ncbi:MAG: acetate--CoA ligase family protein [Nanoarchaeota archaeon]|nr:acetate--CoA ligase family protein [Nanoarchaeota archaeon]
MNTKLQSIHNLFYPSSIAIVGASNDTSKIGGFMFEQIKDHPSITAYAVNSKGEEIQSRESYKSIIEIEDDVEVAIIVIPKQFVLNILHECALKKISKVVIISAGFKEVGEEGKKLEQEITTFCKNNNITLIGPNCLGFLNAELKLNASFAKDIPQSGGVALVSQSGAVIDAIIDWSFAHNIGFSKIISVGNMAGVTQHDFLEYLMQDDKTKSIVFYLESLEEGKKFQELLNKTTPLKPVFILHPGKSVNAQNAIGSHTGSLAHNYELIKTIYSYSNTILVEGFDELFSHLTALKTKLPTGNKILIITNAGGPGVIATDCLDDFNLHKYTLTNEERELFKELPQAASLENPVDILGDADPKRYSYALNTALKTQADGFLILLTPQMMTNSKAIAQEIIELDKETNKPIYCCFLGSKEVKDALSYFDLTNVAYFSSPRAALESYSKLLTYNTSKPLLTNSKSSPQRNIEVQKKGLLNQEETLKICKQLGLKTPKTYLLNSVHDIYTTNFDPHCTYFVKADNILHKKDVGAVKPHIQPEELVPTLEEMFSTFSKENPDVTIIVQEEIKGIEVIAGLKCDESLGNFLLFGSGGTAVDIFKDISFAPTPITTEISQKVINSTLISKLLHGYRGDEAVNIEDLQQALEKISYLPSMYENLVEVDCNPIIVNKEGAYLVDVKLLFK